MPQVDIAPLEPAAGASTTDQVFDLLHRAVVSLDIEPGSKVSEAEIASRLGVSRQPVRDAFFRLSKLGFLLIRPQRATLVTKISSQSVRQAVFVRTALEVACVREAAAQRSDADLEALEAVIQEQKQLIEATDIERFAKVDEDFHQRICEAAKHSYVWPMIEEQKAHMDRVRFLSLSFRGEGVCREHSAILSALREKNPDRAEAELRNHLGHIDQVLDKVRGANRAFFEDGDA